MHNSLESMVESWLNNLRDSGYRLTAPRRAIVEVIAGSDRALNPNQVFERAQTQHPAIGLVTVYRTLEKLEDLGLIDRVHMADGCHAYIASPEGHQHLLICTCCGRVEYFAGDDLEPLIAQVARRSGYDIQEHWLQFFGVCAHCQAQTA